VAAHKNFHMKIDAVLAKAEELVQNISDHLLVETQVNCDADSVTLTITTVGLPTHTCSLVMTEDFPEGIVISSTSQPDPDIFDNGRNLERLAQFVISRHLQSAAKLSLIFSDIVLAQKTFPDSIEYFCHADVTNVIMKLKVPDECARGWRMDPTSYFTIRLRFLTQPYTNCDQYRLKGEDIIVESPSKHGIRISMQLQLILRVWLTSRLPSIAEIIEARAISGALPVSPSPVLEIPTYASEILANQMIPHIFEPSPPTDACAICCEELPSALACTLTTCNHTFHISCLEEMVRHANQGGINCPLCGARYGRARLGSQPSSGQMTVSVNSQPHIPGFEGTGFFTIVYSFPSGICPRTNQFYSATHRVAYLPSNDAGREILALLRVAFHRRLIFRLGESSTTSVFGICWAIHHKTSMHGGSAAYGYPDPTYLERVRAELAEVGVTCEDASFFDENSDDWFQDQSEQTSSRVESALQSFREQPPLDNKGFITQIYRHLCKRIVTLNLFCVVCDNSQPEWLALRVPSCCPKSICQFSFTQLGVGRAMDMEMHIACDVLHLLIVFAYAAASATRWETVFSPFPNFLLTEGTDKDTARTKFIELVSKFSSLASVQDPEAKLGKRMHVWLIQSNIASFVRLSDGVNCKALTTQLGCDEIFYFARADQEATFQRQSTTTAFAFHGSPVANWHSILRSRLVVGNDRNRFRLHGAAYGDGVYISPSFSVSIGYCHTYANNHNNNKKNNFPCPDKSNPWAENVGELQCIAICEIDNTMAKKNGDIWVCPTEEHVILRFLIVRKPSQQIGHTIRTDDCKLSSLIAGAIKEMNEAVLE
jgi:deltex-like protein